MFTIEWPVAAERGHDRRSDEEGSVERWLQSGESAGPSGKARSCVHAGGWKCVIARGAQDEQPIRIGPPDPAEHRQRTGDDAIVHRGDDHSNFDRPVRGGRLRRQGATGQRPERNQGEQTTQQCANKKAQQPAPVTTWASPFLPRSPGLSRNAIRFPGASKIALPLCWKIRPQLCSATISRSASATRRVSVSVPIVMRRPFASPCPGSQRTMMPRSISWR